MLTAGENFQRRIRGAIRQNGREKTARGAQKKKLGGREYEKENGRKRRTEYTYGETYASVRFTSFTTELRPEKSGKNVIERLRRRHRAD